MCIHNLQFIKDILAAALCLCTIWERCRDENVLSNCKRFPTKPLACKSLSLVKEASLAFHKSSTLLTCCLEICIISKLIIFRNTPIAVLDEKPCNAFCQINCRKWDLGDEMWGGKAKAQLSYYLSVIPDSSLLKYLNKIAAKILSRSLTYAVGRI